MCLDLLPSATNVRIAEEDIICYKRVLIMSEENESDSFRTPYYGMIIKIGKTYNSDLHYIDNDNIVTRGLHSFAVLSDAFNNGYGYIVRCIIPKGAEYYTGMFGDAQAYASDMLKYDCIIDHSNGYMKNINFITI